MSEQDTQRASTPLVTDDLQERIAKARQSAQEWRERLGVTGVATPDDTTRLVAAAVPNAEIERDVARTEPALRTHGKPRLYLPAAGDPEQELKAQAWFVGWALHSTNWPFQGRDARTILEKAAAYTEELQKRERVAYAFAEVWRDGPKYVYRSDDPRALELLAPLGLDHFPTLEEARQLAADRPEVVSVEVRPFDATWVISMLGELVFCYPEE